METRNLSSVNSTAKPRPNPVQRRPAHEDSASETTFNTISRELRNLNRERKEVLREGQAITRSGVTYSIARHGRFLAVVDGTTTVDSKEPAVTSFRTDQESAVQENVQPAGETVQEPVTLPTASDSPDPAAATDSADHGADSDRQSAPPGNTLDIIA